MLKSVIKKAVKPTVSSFLGSFFAHLYKLDRSLTIFCYHDTSNNPSEFSHRYDLNVPPNIFEYQVNFIRNNFNVISPDDLLTGNIPQKACLITFDDGFRGYFNTAVPILEKYSLPSINFLNMAPLNGKIFWSGLITYLCDKNPEFYKHVVTNCECNLKEKPLYLYCSREIVESFLKINSSVSMDEVQKFIGEFASLQDLESVSSNNLVFFGNHLYKHEVPLLLSDKELLSSYFENDDELKKYPNYRRLFAFPFGQPVTCYSSRQIEVLLNNGAKRIFSSYPVVNYDISSPYLHRIPMHTFNKTEARIWFNIHWHNFRK